MSRMLLWASLFMCGSHAFAGTSVEERLRTKVQAHAGLRTNAETADWRVTAARLLESAPPAGAGCAEVNRQTIAGTYVLTTDANRRPCRIYDLAFPTLRTLAPSINVGRLPLQTFGARDYLDWLEGRYDRVLTGMREFDPAAAPAPEWTRQLRFKNVSLTAARVPGTSLPTTFAASDLEIGDAFRWDPKDRELITRLIGALPALSTQAEPWQEVLARPESLLAKIKFNWNDVEKVYEIALEGQFLPFNGPIALVDYDRPYKLAVETLLRSLVHSALGQITRFIPPPAKSVIAIAIDDAFEFAQMAYDYQLNRLEETLAYQTELDAVTLERGQNILAGGRADFVSEYLKSILLKQPFQWSAFEDLGRTMRYDAKRHRDIKMSQLNSRMTLDDGCAMTLVHDYFGICSKGGAQRMHSMISDIPVWFWNLGAPLVQDPAMPSKVTLRRAAAYLLSVGARLVELPHLGFLMAELTKVSKQFAFAGVTDEGFLRASLNLRPGTDEELSRWLYIQNLNAFLAKSKASEAAIINANAAQLH